MAIHNAHTVQVNRHGTVEYQSRCSVCSWHGGVHADEAPADREGAAHESAANA